MPMKKNGVFFEGDWSDYYVDTDSLDLNEKIIRMSKLNEIEKDIFSRKKQVFSWMSLPVLMAIFLFFQLLINSIDNSLIRIAGMLGYSVLVILIISPVIIKPKNKVKFRWRRWIFILLLWIGSLKGLKVPTGASAYTTTTLIILAGVFFGLSLLFTLIYLGLSNSGHDEMRLIAKNEKESLYQDIVNKINTARLEPISLKYDIILEQDEIPLMEVDGVLIDEIETEKYYSSSYGSSDSLGIDMSKWFTKVGFGVNTEKIKSDFTKIVNNVASSAVNILGNNPQKNSNYKKSQYQIPTSESVDYDDSIGWLILTNHRILFVGSSKGFQIEYLMLASCTLNRNQKEIISFETTKTVRILATDFSSWIKLYVDRLARDARI